MNWTQAVSDFLDFIKLERSLSENSIAAYRRDMQKFLSFLKEAKIKEGPLEIKANHVQAYVGYIHKSGLAKSSQSRMLSGLRSFYQYLVYEDYLDSNPANKIDMPKIAQKLPEVLSKEEIDLLCTLEFLGKEINEKTRNQLIIEMLYACGLRVSELVELKISNIIWSEQFIKVLGKGDKERLVPIAPDTLKMIEAFLENTRGNYPVKQEAEDILFLNRRGNKLSRAMIFNIIKRAAENAGIKKNISPHTLRHSFATHLVQSGADLRSVQKMLGHESIMTTEIYTHLNTDDLKKVMEKHPRANG